MDDTGISSIPLLFGVERKIERAEEHLAEALRLLDVVSQGSVVVPEADAEGVTFAFRLEVSDPDALLRMALVSGDAAHNLRAALDWLVFALAVGASGRYSPPDERLLEFPIADTRSRWKNVKRAIRNLPDDAREPIEAAQPYHAGDDYWLNPLSILGHINNRDKHRMLPLAAIVPSQINFRFKRPPAGRLIRTQHVFDAMRPNAPFLVMTFSEPNPDPDVDFQLAVSVSLHDGSDWHYLVATLESIRDEVVRLLAELRPLAK